MASSEQLLINAIISSGSKVELNKASFTSDNIAKYRDELFYILESRSVPSRSTFKARFPRFIIKKGIPQSDIPNLIDQCKENKQRADLSKMLLNATKKLEVGEDIKKIVTGVEVDSRNIQSQFSSIEQIEVMSNLGMWASRYKEKRNKVESGQSIGIPYGIPTMDTLTGGMMKKELITIAARVKVGKSWIMCNAAASALMAGYSPMYLSLEMDWDAIANRVFSVISYQLAKAKMEKKKRQKDKDKILNEFVLFNNELNLGELEGKKVAKVMKEIRSKIKANLYVPDIKGKFSITNSRRLIEANVPDVVFFDYFGLTQQASESWSIASEASKSAKEISRIYDIPYVMGAQINRSGAQSESPRLEHLALTDSIGQDSDKVFMLKSLGRRKRIEVICEKFRGGMDSWKVKLNFDVNSGRLEEIGTVGVNDNEEDEEEDF